MSDPAQAPPISGIRIEDPLSSVDLTAPRGDVGRPESSVAAVEGFRSAAAEAQASTPAEEEEKEAPKVESRLTEENHESLQQIAEMLRGAQRLHAEQELIDLENLRKTVERNRHLHDQQPPISIASLLLNDFVEDTVQISEDYSLGFRTIATHVDLDAAEASVDCAQRWENEGKKPGTQMFMQQLSRLVCGMTALCGAPRYAAQIHAEEEREKRQGLIVQYMDAMLALPPEALQDMFAHQALFTSRVRNAFGHAGWVASEVGN
jgi:hypothetical protein